MDFMNKNRQSSGITLIALVITIIVMLILAGVSLSMVVGDNGILTQAKKTVEKNKQATALEQVTMAWAGLKADYYSGWVSDSNVSFSSMATKENLQKYVESTGTINSVVDNEDTTYVIEYTVDNEEKSTYLFLAEENGKVTLMDGLNVVPSTLAMQRTVSGSDVTENPKTVKAVLTNATGTINWTMTGDTSAVELSSTTGTEITVTPKAPGSVTLTAKTADGTYEDTCVITVTQVTAITSVGALSQTAVTINKGASTTVAAPNITPSTATEKLTWESSNPSIAAITPSADGKSVTIAGNAKGTATVTAKAENGNSSSVTVTVNVPVTGVTLNSTEETMSVGDTLDLTATIAPADASNTGVTWSVVQTGTIVNKTDSGNTTTITAAANGTATVTATTADGSYTASCTITVAASVGHFKQVGTTAYYYANASDTTGTPITAANMGQYLGMKVDYTPYSKFSDRGTSTTYRLFYVDINNDFGDGAGTIYLKADQDGKNKTLNSIDTTNKTDVNVMAAFNPKWNTSYSSSTNNNAKYTKYLLDKGIWKGYTDTGDLTTATIANYAVGAPSLEMWIKSYNAFLAKNPVSGKYAYNCTVTRDATNGPTGFQDGNGYYVGYNDTYEIEYRWVLYK